MPKVAAAPPAGCLFLLQLQRIHSPPAAGIDPALCPDSCNGAAFLLLLHAGRRQPRPDPHAKPAPSRPQVLLQKRGLQLNPVTTLYYVAPCCLGFLLLPWALLEAPRLLGSGEPFALDPLLLVSNAVAAFALNMSVSMHGNC